MDALTTEIFRKSTFSKKFHDRNKQDSPYLLIPIAKSELFVGLTLPSSSPINPPVTLDQEYAASATL
jgi:hypothetical protein